MTTTDFSTLRQILLQHQAALQAQLAQLRGGNVGRAEASAAHFGGHEDSQAQTATARETEFALDAHETAELNAIAAALQRLDAGTYGTCIDCGVAIPFQRLQASPQALRCIHCQARRESP